MENPKLIKDWAELSKETSPTYDIKIEEEHGCGWIYPKNANKDIIENSYYLSTHTFYGENYKYATEVLQSCGFNVELANWDEIGY